MVLINSGGGTGLSVGVAADAGIKSTADMAGKRFAWVAGAPGLNLNIEAYLANAGLTWDDVEQVEFGGYGAAWNGLIEGQVDGVFASTNTGPSYEAAAGPRGLEWIPIDHSDTEGFKRMTDIAPFFRLSRVTLGANIDGTEGFDGASYAYPVLITIDQTDPDLVYNMTKAMVELFPQYDGKAPGINGWAIENQDFTWVAPYHEGAVRYFEEIGVWSDEAQARNDELIERQAVLKAAWDKLVEEDPEDWEAAWAEARRAALEEAGQQVVF